MSPKEAATLKVNDRVTWGNDAADAGTVIESGYAAVTIRWDNGQTGTIAFDDTEHVGFGTNAIEREVPNAR